MSRRDDAGCADQPTTGLAAHSAVGSLLRACLDDPACTWTLGAFGALAVVARDPDETVGALADRRLGWSTRRGAIALSPTPDLTPVAYETGFSAGWSQAVALCLPADACAMGGRSVVTELGPDAGAVRPQDRDAILFDLGLGLAAVDACVRSADPAVIACLRAAAGRPAFAPGNPVMRDLAALGPNQVFAARVGRIEVRSPILQAGDASAPGPRTYLLPKLLRRRRTHPATAPIPAGLVPVAALYPPHPCRDGAGGPIPFDPGRHAAFGRLMDRWGDPALTALRRAVLAGETPEADGRFARSAIRAAEAQVRAVSGAQER